MATNKSELLAYVSRLTTLRATKTSSYAEVRTGVRGVYTRPAMRVRARWCDDVDRTIGGTRSRNGLWTATEVVWTVRTARRLLSVPPASVGRSAVPVTAAAVPHSAPTMRLASAHRRPRGRGPRRPMAEPRPPPLRPHPVRKTSPQCLRCSFIIITRLCVLLLLLLLFFFFPILFYRKHTRMSTPPLYIIT